jgi:exonuclease VII large subunit
VQVVTEFVQATEQAWADIASNASELLQSAEHNLSETAIGVKNLVTTALTRSLSNLDVKADRVRRRPSEVLGIATMTLKAIADRVRLLDPVNTMARGWSITRNDKGEVVRSVKSLKVGQHFVTSFADGSAVSAIESIEKEGK